MAKETIRLEFEALVLVEAQKIASEQGLTVRQWMENLVNEGVANAQPPRRRDDDDDGEGVSYLKPVR